jgi:branched-chain amino acid transport system substrate-binding protein
MCRLRHWVVNVRASYYDQTRAQMDGLWNTLSYRKIGVIYPEDAFGTTVLGRAREALQAHGVESVAVGSYERQTASVGAAIDAVRAANPQAVVVIGPPNTVAPILKQAHAKGWKPLFLTVSFVGTDELIREAGEDAEGIVITQVVPPYYLTEFRTVALYRRTLSKYAPAAQPNFVSLDGFVDAMVMVEGLKRAGKELTREGLIRGIESIHDMDADLGTELKLDCSAKDHKGFDNVRPTVVRGGRAVPFTDWSMAAPK